MNLKQNISHTVVTQMISLALSFVAGIFFNRLLGAEGKGFITLLESYLGLGILLIGFSFPSSVVYFLKNRNYSVTDALYFGTVFLICSSLAGFLIYNFISGFELINSLFSDKPSYFFYFLLILFINQFLQEIVVACLSAKYFFKEINYISLTFFGLNLLTYLLLYCIGVVNVFTVIVIFVVLNVLKTVYFCFLLKLKSRELSWGRTVGFVEGSKSIFRYLLTLYFANLLSFLNYKLDIFFIDHYVGMEEVGVYSLAVNLAQMLWLISSPLVAVLFPYFSDKEIAVSEKSERLVTISRLVFMIGMGGAFVGFVIAPFALTMLFGSEFTDSIVPFQILIFAIVFSNVTKILASFNLAFNKSEINLYATLAGFLITLVLNFLLIPRFGAIGAAYSTLFSYTTILIVILMFNKSLHNRRITEFFIVRKTDLDLLIKNGKNFYILR